MDAPPLAPPTPVVADELAARRRRNASWLIAGGAVAVAAAGAAGGGPRATVPRGHRRAGPRRDGHAAIAARVEATGGAPRLTWTPIAGVDGYRITVYRGDGRVAWGPIDAAAPPLDLPSAASLPPGRYRWRVEAVDDGRATARSPLLELVVER
ncbi:MAG: hypothetical protein IPL61_24755 [Myxococcales bacterium]|nr:hypothetical protein [Myxococcales bacterium]